MYKTRPHCCSPHLHINNYVTSYLNFLFVRKSLRGAHTKSECNLDEGATKTEGSPSSNGLSDESGISRNRLKELSVANALFWPRIERHPRTYSITDFRQKWEGLLAGQNANDSKSVCVRGTFKFFTVLLCPDNNKGN